MSEVTTTQKRSAFEYDNVYQGYYQGSLFTPGDYDYLVLKYNGDYYAISSPSISYTDSGFLISNGGNSIKYDSSSMRWGSDSSHDPLPSSAWSSEGVVPYSNIQVMAQSFDSSKQHYYTPAQFRAGSVYAPTGNLFDGIYSYNVLSEVLNLLPVVLVCLIGFIGIRKGIRFVSGFLKGA